MRYILSCEGTDLTIFDSMEEAVPYYIAMRSRGFRVRVRVHWGEFFMDLLTREG